MLGLKIITIIFNAMMFVWMLEFGKKELEIGTRVGLLLLAVGFAATLAYLIIS